MKKNRLTLALLMLVTFTVYAQTGSTTYKLGTTQDFIRNFVEVGIQSPGKALSLQLSAAKSIDVKIIDSQSEGSEIKIYGEVIGVKTSIFYIYGTATNIKGKIVIDSKDGYELSTDEQTQNVVIASVDIHKLICISPGATTAGSITTGNTIKEKKRTTVQPAFSSFPDAPFVLFLNFDGEYVNDSYWNSQMGGAKNCTGPNFSEDKIKSIWAGVAEKYRPWNINVTTDRAMFDAKSKAMRHMVIYTMTWQVSGSGGIADIGSIANNGTDYCWVFYGNIVNDVNDMTVTASHESGHAFGLEHDGTASTNYYAGQGNWGPIMGNNYQTSKRDIWQWSKGEYNGATTHGGGPNVQDDVAIIAANPGVGYRKDEDANTTATARELVAENNGTVLATKNNGVITTRTDKDYFKFSTTGGVVTFNFQSSDKIWALDEAVLDIQARLLDANGTELSLSNPIAGSAGSANPYGLDASISKSVGAGTYYLEIDGVGYLDPKTTGYSDYASIGYYQISGSYPVSITGIKEQQLSSNSSLYPNPANDRLFIAFADPSTQVISVKIMDALGKTIHQVSQVPIQEGIEIGQLAPGVYLLQVSDEKTKASTVKKFIKQ
jgi:hypothetical protein